MVMFTRAEEFAAVFSREVIGSDAQFLNVFGIGIYVGDTVALAGINGCAVNQEAVGFGTRAVGTQVYAKLGIENVSTRLRVRLATAAGEAGHARCQDNKCIEVSAGQRQVVDLAFFDFAGNAAFSRFD